MKSHRFLLGGVSTFLFTMVVSAQNLALNSVQAIPVGQKPMGIGIVYSDIDATQIAVANSGENSVTILQSNGSVFNAGSQSSAVVTGIPAPFGIGEACLPVVATSPSTNSISVIDTSLTGAVSGMLKATITVGPLPYSAACSGATAFVSNYGDSSVSVVDLSSLTVTKTIPNVPGSRSVRGIAVDKNGFVWVAGTDANVVTIVNPTDSAVVSAIPIHSPSFVISMGSVWVGSLADNSIYGFDADRLTIATTIQNIATPQDFVPYTLVGQFAAMGSANSAAWIIPAGMFRPLAPAVITLIPNIPGAAGIVGGSGCEAPLSCGYAMVTSPATNQVFLISVGPPPSTPHDFAVANGASFGTSQVAAGQLASLFAATGVSQNFNAATIPLPFALGGVSMKIGGTLTFDATTGNWDYSSTGAMDVPLVFVGPNQVNFQMPPGTPPGDAVPVELIEPDGSTLLSTMNITATGPGIFSVLMNGQGQGAVLNQDNSQNFGTNPAARGSVIQIFATGGGDTTPPLAPGDAAPASGNPLVQTNATATVTIGGVTEAASFSGMAPGFVGLWQINAEVPASVTSGPAVPLSVNIGGVQSNTVTIAVQ